MLINLLNENNIQALYFLSLLHVCYTFTNKLMVFTVSLPEIIFFQRL